MNKSTSIKTASRVWIVLSLLSLAGLAFTFEYANTSGWTTSFTIIEITLIVILLISLTMGFGRTGLWAFSHRSLKTMDEREVMVTSHSLRIAYSVFSIIVLCALLCLSLTERPISIVSVASFILFAHLLPASIVGWSKKA